MTGGQANFLQSLGWAVLNSLWQLALLWVIYQLITGLYRKTSSAAKSSLASLLLVAGFGWFLYTFFHAFLHEPTPGGGVIASSTLVNAEANPELSNWLQKTLPVASVVYLVLLVFPVLHYIRNYRYVQVIRKYGLSKIDVDWRIFVNKIASQLGIRKKVKVWVSELVSSPVTIGFIKPVILVPVAAINHLTPQQVEAVLLHELSHIRRYDYLVNLVINFIQSVLYFNPFVRAFVKIVEKEREKSCDEMVLQFQYDSHEYASALLTLEKNHHHTRPFVMAASGKKHQLLNRIELIMGVNKKPAFAFQRMAGFMAGLLCVIALNAILIISKPEGDRAARFASLRSLDNFFTVEAPFSVEQPTTIVNKPVVVKPAAQVEKPVAKKTKPKPAGYVASAFSTPEFENISNDIKLANFEALGEIPELKKYQEAQVREAVEVSKKVIASRQWKVVEKSLGDAFTRKEKEVLKANYKKQVEKAADWKALENQLRLAYDKLDWDKVNNQLSSAMNNYRIDSLTRVYTYTMDQLAEVQKEMSLNNITVIPDTDISSRAISQKQREIQRALNLLKAARTKKIVHL